MKAERYRLPARDVPRLSNQIPSEDVSCFTPTIVFTDSGVARRKVRRKPGDMLPGACTPAQLESSSAD